MEYIIGVDGGGTKTEATAYNLNDQALATFIAGPANPAIDYTNAEENIRQAISRCILQMKTQGIEGDCKGIFMGVAGIEVGENKQRLEASITNTFCCKVFGLHDSELTHVALLKGQDGIITIAGTGSVSYGIYQGKAEKTGGWGHVLGDEGSGYWIALEALKNMTLECDAGLKPSGLSRAILSQLNLSDVFAMKEFVHHAGKYEIARVAQAVVEQAVTGNIKAISILDLAGQELAAMTIRLYRKLGVKDALSVATSGGILQNVDRVREKFQACLQGEIPEVTILSDNISPTKGACYLYRQMQQKTRTRR